MNCENCLHYGVCKVHYSLGMLALIDGNCSNYDDRTEWLRLPKVGDTVYCFRGGYYRKNRSDWEITPIKVTEISMKINKSGRVMPLSIIANGTRYPISSIGKTVFLSREEAEQALNLGGKK